MTFDAIDAWWWPFVFILVAGWAATDFWRFLGVHLGSRLSEHSDVLVLVRSVATALVAGVIGNLVIFPAEPLASTPMVLRVGAMAVGFAAYLLLGRRVIVAILVAEMVFGLGLWAGV